MTLARQEGGFLSLPRSFLSMEGMEHILLIDGSLDDDPVLSYTLGQLRHHEVTQVLLANLPPKVVEERI
jgi:hypothetical protein